MKLIWDRIHVWLAANAPEVLESLCPGATDEQIRAAEREMGVTFPDDVRECYRIHDGQRRLLGRQWPWPPTFLYGAEWQRCEVMLAAWRSMMSLVNDGTFSQWRSKPKGPIRTEWWHPAWIPLTSNHCGDVYCLDLVPRRGGRVGQIIHWAHDSAERGIEARGFTQWLARFADEMEQGYWMTDPRYHGLVDVNAL
jgi:cell wall assembly regulator SMI1